MVVTRPDEAPLDAELVIDRLDRGARFVVVPEAQDTHLMDESYVPWFTFMTMVCE